MWEDERVRAHLETLAGEDIAVEEVEIEEALAMIDTGAIRDAKTIMLLQYAALRLFPAR